MDENDDIIIPEKKTNGLKFNLEELEKIKKQMLSGVCKIKDGKSNGTGFFIKIIDKKNNNRKIGALITNAHVLGKNDIGKDEDIITYELNNKKNYIKGMKDRKRYIDEILDITIIEIKEQDEIKDEQYLELEDIENDSLYKTESKQTFLETKYKDLPPIYAIGYPTDQKITVSFGNINNIIIDKTAFIHSCDTDSGSSGSPIFSKESFKVFSVHTGYYLNNSKNTSVLIFDAIKKFLNINDNLIYINNPKWKKQENEQKNRENNNKEIDDKSQEKQTKQNSMFIKYIIKENSETVKIFGRKFVKKNKSKCKMIIKENSPNQLDIKEYYSVNDTIKKNGCFYLKLIELTPIEDMSYIFGKFYHDEGSVQIQKLKDINWDTNYVTNMSKFFCECNELIEVNNLSKLNTQNVNNMSFFFFGCEQLKKIDGIEKWKVNNVENMSNMFAYCKKLKSLPNFKEWNVENVKDLSYMFYHCESIDVLKGIQNWNIKNLNKYTDFFTGCKSLTQKPDISSWGNICFK